MDSLRRDEVRLVYCEASIERQGGQAGEKVKGIETGEEVLHVLEAVDI
jgi:hypothetical protein